MNKKDYKKLAKKLNDFEEELHAEYGWFTTQQEDGVDPRMIFDTALFGVPVAEGQQLWPSQDITSRWYLQRDGEEWVLMKDES